MRLVFGVCLLLNLCFVGVETVYGFVAGSMALLADAGHNLGDVLGLGAAWAANVLAQRSPSRRFTYGLRSSSILAALFNAIILMLAVGAIIVEAAQRLLAPEPIAGLTVIVVAGIGILINGLTAALLLRGEQADLNVRSAVAHMVGDMVVSGAVALSGAIILASGWQWLDPMVSIIIAVVIVVGTGQLLLESLNLALNAVPVGIDRTAVEAFLSTTAGVCGMHDLHIWPMSTTETALTCHLIMPDGHPGDAALDRLAHDLHDRFAIDHATVQIETGDPAHPCRLVPDDVV